MAAGAPLLRVLLVDDHLDTVHAMSHLLARGGFAVQYATTGDACCIAGRGVAKRFRIRALFRRTNAFARDPLIPLGVEIVILDVMHPVA